MDIKDFKTIKEQHAEICKEIIEQGGACRGIACSQCPFEYNNSTYNWGCMHYVIEETDSWEKSPSLVKSARLFLSIYEHNTKCLFDTKVLGELNKVTKSDIKEVIKLLKENSKTPVVKTYEVDILTQEFKEV